MIKQHAVIQTDDYYPFGLTFNSYRRSTAKENKLNTFQDQELITDLDLNWVQFKWRNHDPSIGRFFNVDPLADKYVYNSPYAFSENHVTSHIELEGLEKISIQSTMVKNKTLNAAYNVQRQTSGGKEFHSKVKDQSTYNVIILVLMIFQLKEQL